LQVWNNWQIWRSLTCILPHADPLHLAFNLYWWWTFGVFLERTYGHLKFLAIVILFAFCASLTEFMFLSGGIGLSGVVYGLWGLLWALERNDPRFANIIDQQTSSLFVKWFFICIVLTVTNLLPIANLAHAVGAIAGGLLGFVLSTVGKRKRWAFIALIALVILPLLGSTLFWPWVNLSDYKYEAFSFVGWQALDKGDNSKALRWLERGVKNKNADAETWFNLGIAYHRLDRDADALRAYERAAQLPSATSEMRQLAQRMRALVGRQKL
jgi:membrane associated rhomboid family serine protease